MGNEISDAKFGSLPSIESSGSRDFDGSRAPVLLLRVVAEGPCATDSSEPVRDSRAVSTQRPGRLHSVPLDLLGKVVRVIDLTRSAAAE